MADKDTTVLIIKCIKFYIDNMTAAGTKCPTVDQMREIIKLDDILKNLTATITPTK